LKDLYEYIMSQRPGGGELVLGFWFLPYKIWQVYSDLALSSSREEITDISGNQRSGQPSCISICSKNLLYLDVSGQSGDLA